MRPVYEKDRVTEDEFAREIERRFGVRMERRKDFDVVDQDVMIRDGSGGWRLYAVAELKCRSNSSVTYPDLMVGLRKYEGIQYEAGKLGVRGFLFVRWSDCAGVYLMPKRLGVGRGVDLRWSGRTKNARDQFDIETCAHIPIRLFKRWVP